MFTQDLLLKPYTKLKMGIIPGHAQKHSGMFCNGVVIMVSAHQFCSFLNLLVIKTGFISSFCLFENLKQGIALHRTMYISVS